MSGRIWRGGLLPPETRGISEKELNLSQASSGSCWKAHIIEYGPLPNEAGLVNLTLEKELILIIKNLNIKTGIKCVVSVHIIDNYMHLMITS